MVTKERYELKIGDVVRYHNPDIAGQGIVIAAHRYLTFYWIFWEDGSVDVNSHVLLRLLYREGEVR